jgi:hypothetical protein
MPRSRRVVPGSTGDRWPGLARFRLGAGSFENSGTRRRGDAEKKADAWRRRPYAEACGWLRLKMNARLRRKGSNLRVSAPPRAHLSGYEA